MTVLVGLLLKYNDDQKANMLNSASDRAEVSARAVAHFGGKLLAAYGSYGEYDMLFIYEMPDDFSVAANMHLVDGFGVAKYSKIIPLLSNESFVETQKAAGQARQTYMAVPDGG